MGLLSIIGTAARAFGIGERAAARLVAAHGREAVASTLTHLADVLDGRRLSQTTLKALPTELASTLSRTLDQGIHGAPKPPVLEPMSRSNTVFTTRKPPRTVNDKMRQPQKKKDDEEDEGGWSPLVRTPGSSNVYSFRYFREAGQKLGILEVTFKAMNFHAGSLTKGSKKHRGKDTMAHGLTGILGKTVKGGKRPDSPGVVYHYRLVPPAIFYAFCVAASAGKFVWRELRVRHQLHGGKFPYSVASGDINLAAGGAYLPRRAVAAPGGGTAFRTRTLAEIGNGRRGFIVSSLSSGVRPLGGGGGFTTRPAPGSR